MLTVSAPTEGDLYRAGDTITYNAFAHDAAGFDLDDGDIKTEVRLHHGSHFHPFVGPLTGRAGHSLFQRPERRRQTLHMRSRSPRPTTAACQPARSSISSRESRSSVWLRLLPALACFSMAFL